MSGPSQESLSGVSVWKSISLLWGNHLLRGKLWRGLWLTWCMMLGGWVGGNKWNQKWYFLNKESWEVGFSASLQLRIVEGRLKSLVQKVLLLAWRGCWLDPPFQGWWTRPAMKSLPCCSSLLRNRSFSVSFGNNRRHNLLSEKVEVVLLVHYEKPVLWGS